MCCRKWVSRIGCRARCKSIHCRLILLNPAAFCQPARLGQASFFYPTCQGIRAVRQFEILFSGVTAPFPIAVASLAGEIPLACLHGMKDMPTHPLLELLRDAVNTVRPDQLRDLYSPIPRKLCRCQVANGS